MTRILGVVCLLGLIAGCGDDIPAEPYDSGANDVDTCQPDNSTFVFTPCDDGKTAACEVRSDGGSSVPSCVVQGRKCVESCTTKSALVVSPLVGVWYSYDTPKLRATVSVTADGAIFMSIASVMTPGAPLHVVTGHLDPNGKPYDADSIATVDGQVRSVFWFAGADGSRMFFGIHDVSGNYAESNTYLRTM